MLAHHRRALDLAVARLSEDPGVRLVLLGGSIAKGTERPDSDVDLIVLVEDADDAARLARGEGSFLWADLADWAGGYVEGRFVSRSFVLAAAERGSEPTRWSFLGAKPVWGEDSEVEAALPLIPVYPEQDRERRLDAFLAQMSLARGFFWSEGVRRGDPYLKNWSATRVVLFAARLVLAHDRVLFPNQKRLMETLAGCPSCPQGFQTVAGRGLAGDESALDEICAMADGVVGPRDVDVVARFQRDAESSWYEGSHDIAEW